MLTIRATSDGKGYSSRHLEHSDYYAEGELMTGVWQGRGAELLGLKGAVRGEDFEAVRQGLDPQTKEFLRVRHSADRTAIDGTKVAQGHSLYDFTISAPKSVSVLAIVGGDDRLVEAHRTAVAEALKEAENYAATRVRQAGANEDRPTGNLALAVYHHDASRELDPQLHTHAVAANLTFDGTEARWKALQASDIYERRAYLSEVYRNSLAREVCSLGYEIENQRDARGRDVGFEIRGVSPELLEKFSQRSRQRDKAIEVFIEQRGRRPTDNEVAVLVRESRADKLTEISTLALREKQRARLSPNEAKTLVRLCGVPRLTLAPEASTPSLEYAKGPRRNPERGFAKLDAMGAVREVAFADRATAIADAYAAAVGQTLVVCTTHDEIDRVTEAIRERKRTRGELGEGIAIARHVSLNWTKAQKADLQNYRPGQLMGFHRSAKSIAKYETVEVVDVAQKRYHSSPCRRNGGPSFSEANRVFRCIGGTVD